MEAFRVTKDSPKWLFEAYDYARTDAFVFGQNIPITAEYSHDEPVDDMTTWEKVPEIYLVNKLVLPAPVSPKRTTLHGIYSVSSSSDIFLINV